MMVVGRAGSCSAHCLSPNPRLSSASAQLPKVGLGGAHPAARRTGLPALGILAAPSFVEREQGRD